MAVQTITYDDKSYLNQNSDIADVNKVNDTDMNEIKAVVNNNATEVENIQNGLNYLVQTFSNASCTQNTSNSLAGLNLTTGTWLVAGQFNWTGSDLRYYFSIGSYASTSAYDNNGNVAGNVCAIINVTGESTNAVLTLWPTNKNVTVNGSFKAVKYQ